MNMFKYLIAALDILVAIFFLLSSIVVSKKQEKYIFLLLALLPAVNMAAVLG